MKFTTTLKHLFLAGAAVFSAGASIAQNPHEEIMADLNKAGGVFYMYSFDTPAATPPPQGYKPFYISHYGRHGARYVDESRVCIYVAEVLGKAYTDGKLTPLGLDTYHKYMKIYPTLKNHAGALTEKGRLQHKKLAKRMYANFPEIFKKKPHIEANSTVVPRCIASMGSFCESLKEEDASLSIAKDASQATMYYLNPQSSGNPAGTKKDLEYKTSKAPWRPEHRKFCKERVNTSAFLPRLFSDVEYAKTICDPLTFESDMHLIAVDMQCTDFNVSFDDLFTPEEQIRLWECENYRYYAEKGPDPRSRGRMPALSETLLNNIVVSAEQDMADGKTNVRLRFGHDGCIMALLTLMQIDGWSTPVTDPLKIKEVWQSYNIPMASNVQWIFYQNPKTKDILVRMMLNEKEIKLPLPGAQAPYYRWEDFKNFYTQVVNQARITLEQTQSILTGVVRADGTPLAGVQVSDGLQIVTTDQKGRYRMESDKAEGLVFVITPSNYVAKSADGLQPAFWAPLTKGEGTPEQHDFELRKEDQKAYTMLFITDVHLTDSNVKHDLAHFKKLALPRLKDLQAKYAPKGPVYSLNLGDLSHDLYWYEFDFSVANARDFLVKEKYPTRLYSLPGNHDNDGAVTGEDVDFKAGWLYRKTFGPTYYSMNIGGAHWIMMDDIVYKNTPNTGKKAPGIAGARDYNTELTQKQMEWLRLDLASVDSTAPIYLCTHAPILYYNKRGVLLSRTSQVDSLNAMFGKFSKVNIFSGHAHKLVYLKNDKYPRFEQCILPATSGNMWTTSNDFQTICTDGTDAGFVVGNYQGKKSTYTYYTEAYGEKVLRAYDMNSVGAYYRTDDGIRQFLQTYPARLNYGLPEYENFVYINYWNYKPGERVEMYENGKALSVAKVEHEDPLFNISYYVPVYLESPKFKAGDAKESNMHMFAAKAAAVNSPIEIRIVDASGKIIHTETITRPKTFDKNMK